MARSKTFRKKRKYKHSNNKRTSKKTSKKTYKKRRTMKGGEVGTSRSQTPLNWFANRAMTTMSELAGPVAKGAIGDAVRGQVASQIHGSISDKKLANALVERAHDPNVRKMAYDTMKHVGANVISATRDIFAILEKRLAEAQAREIAAQQQVVKEEQDESINLALMQENQLKLNEAKALGKTIALKKEDILRLEEETRLLEEEARKEEERTRRQSPQPIIQAEVQNNQLIDELDKAVADAKANAEAAKTRKAEAIKRGEMAQEQIQALIKEKDKLQVGIPLAPGTPEDPNMQKAKFVGFVK